MPPLTPLLHPERFFSERDLVIGRVLAVVGVLIVIALAAFYGIGWVITVHVDGTVLVDNPERPPEWVCEQESSVLNQSGCDEPRQIEQNVDSQLWNAWNNVAGQLIVAIPLGWLLFGVLLHVGSWFVGGENGVFPSFAVAAWGLVPSLVSGILITIALYVTFDPITVTPANQDTALEAVKTSLQTINTMQIVLNVVTAVWSATIWRYGLEYKRGVSGPAAWLVAGTVAMPIATAGFI